MVTELPDTIEIRHTITRSFVRYIFVTCSLTYFDMYDYLAIRKQPRSTLCPKKTCDYIFYINFNNRCPITIIFGIVSSKSMRHRKMVSFPTSPI